MLRPAVHEVLIRCRDACGPHHIGGDSASSSTTGSVVHSGARSGSQTGAHSAIVGGVNDTLQELLRRRRGAVTWADAARTVPEHILEYAVRAGHVTRLFPRTLVHPAVAADPSVRRRAALLCAGPGAALSHTSALAVWGLPADDGASVHVMTGPGRRIRAAGITAHRREGFRAVPPNVVTRRGLPVVAVEQSLIDAWPLGLADARRAPILAAVAERVTTPSRLREALTDTPNLPRRQVLSVLIDRLEDGCRSELEIWGYDRVFSGRGMPRFRRQVPIGLGPRTIHLDVYAEQQRVDFELDGARWHHSPAQRERDLRRDAALATQGIMVVRYSHDRLVTEPASVRREVLAILAARTQALDTYRRSQRPRLGIPVQCLG